MSDAAEPRPLKWHAMLALMSAMIAVAIGYGIVLPILPFLVERLAGTAEPATFSRHTGFLTGVYALALFLFAPLWGRISDRCGRRRILLLGLGGFALTLTLFAFVDSLPLLYFGRFVTGLFAAAVAPVAYALVGEHAPTREWRAHRFALLNASGSAGLVVGPMVGGFTFVTTPKLSAVEADPGLLVPSLAVSVLALLAALIIRALVPVQGNLPSNRIAASMPRSGRTTILRMLLISFVAALAVGAFEVGLSLRGKQVLGLSANQIGVMFTECTVVMFFVQTLVFSPLIRPDATRHLVTPGLTILVVGLAFVPFASTYTLMLVAVALIAASAGILSPIAVYWISLGAGETQGRDLGRQTAAASLGAAIGAAATGVLFDIAVMPNASFVFAAALVASGLVTSIGLSKSLTKAARSTRAPFQQKHE